MSDPVPAPVITTIIPTYRRPKLLRRAIHSVLNQSFPDLQACVYDNASGDETASVVQDIARSDPRVKYHCHTTNIGAFMNFLYGTKCVDTPFFSFLSDDDFLLPEFYREALMGFNKHPEAMFSATTVVDMYKEGHISGIPLWNWAPGLYRPPAGLVAMLKHYPPGLTGILFRREVTEKVGLFDEEVGLPSDMDFELRIAAHWPFVISLQPGAVFWLDPLNTSISARFHTLWPGWLKMIHNIVDDEEIPRAVRGMAETVLMRWLGRRVLSDALKSIRQRNWAEVYEMAQILRTRCGRKTWAALLGNIAMICEHFPPARSFGLSLFELRKLVARGKTWRLEKDLRTYALQLERPRTGLA